MQCIERSRLQNEAEEYLPLCGGDKDGQHCLHLDTHDCCCDCWIRLVVREDGEIAWHVLSYEEAESEGLVVA